MVLLMPTLFLGTPFEDEPENLLLHSAQRGDIAGMKRLGLSLYNSEQFGRRSLLHLAAQSKSPTGAEAVRWLLEQGIPWSALDEIGNTPELYALHSGNEASRKVLREWAVDFEYRLYYAPAGSKHPYKDKPFEFLLLNTPKDNECFCNSKISYETLPGASKEEVAMCIHSCHFLLDCDHGFEHPTKVKETARLLLENASTSDLRILNIGFGVGMIDSYFQEARPAAHVIVEGHPACLNWMKEHGWEDKPGVHILPGRWQDFLSIPPSQPSKQWPLDFSKFDIIYFDTFHEGYAGHFEFIKHVPRLLRCPNSRFSFFNGHAQRDRMAYEIYAEVARLHLNDLGLNTEWHSIEVDRAEVWHTLSDRGTGDPESQRGHKKLLQLIPICQLAPTVPQTLVENVGWNVETSDREERDV